VITATRQTGNVSDIIESSTDFFAIVNNMRLAKASTKPGP